MSKPPVKHFRLRVEKTAHYYCLGDLDENTRVITWLFHGYGQRAPNMLKKFDVIVDEGVYCMAPEGMSRFYWKGVDGEVVSSWMTREDRYDEIADQVAFLDNLFMRYPPSLVPGGKTILFGFSQGCATLWRWILNHHIPVDHIVLWAGWLPEDMNYKAHLDYLNSIPIMFVYGNKDEYLTRDRIKLLKRRFEAESIMVEYFKFEGNHRLSRPVLREVFNNYLLP